MFIQKSMSFTIYVISNFTLKLFLFKINKKTFFFKIKNALLFTFLILMNVLLACENFAYVSSYA